MTRQGFLTAVACIGASAGAMRAQQPVSPLQPVEAGAEDIGPLRISTRLLPTDLRAPTSFDRVYRIPGATTGVAAIEGERFARVSGGLTAVFPRSEYLQTTKHTYTLIPSDTVFYIGGLPPAGGAPKPALPPENLASTRVSTQVSDRVGPVDLRVHAEDGGEGFVKIQTRPDAAMPPDNVMVNDTYRRQRLRAMLMAAVHTTEAAE